MTRHLDGRVALSACPLGLDVFDALVGGSGLVADISLVTNDREDFVADGVDLVRELVERF